MDLPQSHRATEPDRQGERKTKRKSPCSLFSLSLCLCVSVSLWRILLFAALRLRPFLAHLREFLPAVFFDPLGELILAAGQVFEFAPHLQVILEARGVERAGFQRLPHRAVRLDLMPAIAEATLRGQFFYI